MDEFAILVIAVRLSDAVRKTSVGLGKEIKLYQTRAHQKWGRLQEGANLPQIKILRKRRFYK